MGKKLTTEEFIEKSKMVHGDRYDYSNTYYINTHTKVCIICPEHGEFWQTPANHLLGNKCPKCSSIEVHNNQSNGKDGFIEKAKLVHGDKYDYSKVEYFNNHTKVCIICPYHGEFWQKPLKHTQGNGCPYCGGTKKLTTEEFIEKAKLVHGDRYDYSKVEYITTDKKVCIICSEHGEFYQTPHAHINGQGCPTCVGAKKLTTEEFIEKAKLVHGDKYDYSKVEYINTDTKVRIICIEHGEFYQTPHAHINGQGCPTCVGTKKLTTEEFIEKAKLVHGDRYDYSKVEYVNTYTKVCIICSEHGEFWQTPHNHIIGYQGCPDCNNLKNSKIVQTIENKLNELNILFEKEKTFDWLVNKSNMYIDFYLPEYNAGIECHGIQHFKPIDFFGGVEEYNETKYRDFLKYKLCSEHNIKIYYFTKIDLEYFDKIYCDENMLMEDICKVKQK